MTREPVLPMGASAQCTASIEPRYRRTAAQPILAAADKRDNVADARDTATEKRETDLDRAEMLDPPSDYGAHWPERRDGGLNRAHAKSNRAASRDDRNALTEDDTHGHELRLTSQSALPASQPTY